MRAISTIRGATLALCVALAIAGSTLALPARADGISSEQANQIIDELKQIRILLEKQQAAQANEEPPAPSAPKSVTVSLDNKESLGDSKAPIALVEFSDYQCPFCRRFQTETYAELKRKYIDTGKLQFATVDFPLDAIHNNAMHAANAARCAGEQGQFWALRDRMITNAADLSRDAITRYAASLNLNTDALNACIDAGRWQKTIDANIAEAKTFGVSGTPTFVLGTRKGSKVTGRIIVGALPTTYFENAVDQLLAQPAAGDTRVN